MATIKTAGGAWSPDLNTFAPADVIPDAIMLQTSTVAGKIEGDAPSVRVAFVDDATAAFAAEGTEIPEAAPGLSEVTIFTGKISQLVRLSREQYSQPGASAELSDSVRRAIVKKANQAYLTQAKPTSPAVTPPAGILNAAGIKSGGAVAGNLDALIDLVATLEGNGGTPTHIVVDPTGWASLRKLKTATGAATGLLGAGTTDAVPMLLSLPVIVTPAMTAGTGAILDRSAVVAAAGPVTVATSDQVYFTSDGVALRCTWRIGWNLVHPDRIGKFTVTAS